MLTKQINNNNRDEKLEFNKIIAERDSIKYGKIYENWFPPLLLVAERILQNKEQAEDVVQDFFVDVWADSSRKYTVRSSLQGWIKTIIRNRCYTLSDRQKRYPVISIDEQYIETSTMTGNDSSIEIYRIKLMSAIESLTSVLYRDVLLDMIAGFSNNEIAESQEISRHVVSERKFRAKQALIRELKRLGSLAA